MASDTASPATGASPPDLGPPAIPERTTPSTAGAASGPRRRAAPGDGARTTAHLIRDTVTGIQSLLRKEVALARQELKEFVDARVRALVATAAGGVLGLLAVGFLGAALAKGLEEALAPWLAWLIVGVVFLVAAGGALLVARNQSSGGPAPLSRTKASLRESRQRMARFRRR